MNRLLTKIASSMLALIMITGAGSRVRAQETSNQAPTGAVPAATGPDTEPQTIENPPLSGLDQPSFEPGFGARSYLVPKLQVSEAVDSNPSGSLGNQTIVKDVTRGLGSLTLQKLWKIHPLDIDYSGGASWYPGRNGHLYQLHSLGAVQRILWRTGQLSLRDSFSYLPQGNFGFNSFGGAGGFTGGTQLPSNGLGGPSQSQFGTGINQPRINNMSVVDVTQAFSPRSSVTFAGGYGFSDFLNNPNGYVNSTQVTGQVGYNRQISRTDQIAVLYSYQHFEFPSHGAGLFNAQAVQALYGHRISGKFDLQLGGGPQWIQRHLSTTTIPGQPTNTNYITGTGRATLTYFYNIRTNLNLTYSHSANAGSGFFSGANSDAVRLALVRSLTRRWSMMTDTGYSYSRRVLNVATAQAGNAQSYRFWYAGGTLRWQLARHFGTFADYQYDAIGFPSGICSNAPCSTSRSHHVGLIGLDWTPNPIRLD
jgi:hypothetical protein